MAEHELSKELGAMAAIEKALAELTDEERVRVLTWAGSRFDVVLKAAKGKKQEETDDDATPPDPNAVASLAEFYDQASPSSDGEKVLVVGYWYQYREQAQELEAQTLNAQLKHLGHGIGNITRAMGWATDQKPALMVQKRKEGTTKQARKKFVVTNEGKKYVEKMLAKRSVD
jgi:hypothetical protein